MYVQLKTGHFYKFHNFVKKLLRPDDFQYVFNLNKRLILQFNDNYSS